MEEQTKQQRRCSDEDLEHLSLVDIEAAMTMSVTDAVFSCVLPHYPVGAHIQCRCQVADERDLTAGCWIGLFKVGWASAETDCVCRAECRREGDSTLAAVFTQTQLPRDTQDFYQFCFVAPGGLVKGASSPFLFRGAPADDFVAELDEEVQGVVVSARNAKLENSLANMRLEHEAKQSAAEEEAEQLRRQVSALTGELQAARERLSGVSDCHRQLDRRAAEAESEAERLRAELASRCVDLERLDGARQSAAARLVGAEDERERLLGRLAEAAREAEAANDQAEAARKTLAMHAEERQRICEEVAVQRALAEEGSERLRLAEISLADAEERERRLVERVAQTEAAADASDRAAAAHEAAKQRAESELARLRTEAETPRHQLETASAELRAQQARYASLMIAYEGVKAQFHSAVERERLVRVKYDDVIDFNKQMLQREEKLHARSVELQSRLKEGASEYKKLLKRFKELQQFQQCQQFQQPQLEAAEPDEFHDAQGDSQSLCGDNADDVIHRPPPMLMEEAAEASTPPPPAPEKVCPMCSKDDFGDEQHDYEEHVYGHF